MLRQARQLSARKLVVAVPTPTIQLSAMRQWRPLASTRPYSSTSAESKVAEDLKETEATLEKESAVNAELEKVAKELEAKVKEAKDYKVRSPSNTTTTTHSHTPRTSSHARLPTSGTCRTAQSAKRSRPATLRSKSLPRT